MIARPSASRTTRSESMDATATPRSTASPTRSTCWRKLPACCSTANRADSASTTPRSRHCSATNWLPVTDGARRGVCARPSRGARTAGTVRASVAIRRNEARPMRHSSWRFAVGTFSGAADHVLSRKTWQDFCQARDTGLGASSEPRLCASDPARVVVVRQCVADATSRRRYARLGRAARDVRSTCAAPDGRMKHGA